MKEFDVCVAPTEKESFRAKICLLVQICVNHYPILHKKEEDLLHLKRRI
jgi:hypothetical protein